MVQNYYIFSTYGSVFTKICRMQAFAGSILCSSSSLGCFAQTMIKTKNHGKMFFYIFV